MGKINLPSRLTEDTWFYKEPRYQKQLEPYLGKFYISISSVESWLEYKESFIKEKFVKLPQPFGIYKEFGTYLGEAMEKGQFGDNPHNFVGQENFDLDVMRPEGAEYEKLIVIDRGEYIIIGFIDRYIRVEKGAQVLDLKSGGKTKEAKYQSEDYVQVMLYAYALQEPIDKTSVYFVRREGSHINPPLKISKEQFEIPLEFNVKRVKYALYKVDKAVREISELFTTYQKYFTD